MLLIRLFNNHISKIFTGYSLLKVQSLLFLVSNGSSCVSVDLDNDGHICDFELHELLKDAGHSLPGFKVREIIQKLDHNNDNKISFEEFLSVS